MNTFNGRITLVLLLSIAGLLACNPQVTEPSPSPVTSSQYRLKSVQSTLLGNGTLISGPNSLNGATYTYTYDAQNRLTKIDRVRNGQVGQALISYGDPQRTYVGAGGNADYTFYIDQATLSDPTTWSVTRYPLTLDGTNFVAGKYGTYIGPVINTQYNIINYQYRFDTDKHLKSFETSGGPNSGISDYNISQFTYSGDDVGSETYSYSAGHGDSGGITYIFDNKPNPFYSLLDPAISVIERFSQHNTTSQDVASFRTGLSSTRFAYEYNAQGLPTKRTTNNNGVVTETLAYTYEKY